MIGSNGSGDAVGTWLLLMVVAGLACSAGGLLALTGRWRGWYRPVDSPIRYAPLAGMPFGLGCLVEAVSTVVPLGSGPRQVVAVLLLLCLLLSGLLFLRFPAALRPAWVRQLDERADLNRGRPGDGTSASEPNHADR